LDFTEARDSEWPWHQLGHMQVCTSLQQTTTPASHHSVFTGLMPFLPPNQQRQGTEGRVEETGTHTQPFNGPFSGTTQVSRYQKVKPIWILLKQERVSGSGISWAICKSAPCSRQITAPAPHHSVFYRPDALPAAQPTSVKALKAKWKRQERE